MTRIKRRDATSPELRKTCAPAAASLGKSRSPLFSSRSPHESYLFCRFWHPQVKISLTTEIRDQICTHMRVSKAIRVFTFGLGVTLGLIASAPKALGQG